MRKIIILLIFTLLPTQTYAENNWNIDQTQILDRISELSASMRKGGNGGKNRGVQAAKSILQTGIADLDETASTTFPFSPFHVDSYGSACTK